MDKQKTGENFFTQCLQNFILDNRCKDPYCDSEPIFANSEYRVYYHRDAYKDSTNILDWMVVWKFAKIDAVCSGTLIGWGTEKLSCAGNCRGDILTAEIYVNRAIFRLQMVEKGKIVDIVAAPDDIRYFANCIDYNVLGSIDYNVLGSKDDFIFLRQLLSALYSESSSVVIAAGPGPYVEFHEFCQNSYLQFLESLKGPKKHNKGPEGHRKIKYVSKSYCKNKNYSEYFITNIPIIEADSVTEADSDIPVKLHYYTVLNKAGLRQRVQIELYLRKIYISICLFKNGAKGGFYYVPDKKKDKDKVKDLIKKIVSFLRACIGKYSLEGILIANIMTLYYENFLFFTPKEGNGQNNFDNNQLNEKKWEKEEGSAKIIADANKKGGENDLLVDYKRKRDKKQGMLLVKNKCVDENTIVNNDQVNNMGMEPGN